ncbi:MAG: hypothetical protein ACE361_15110 [Aureliella sp.]
MSDQNQPDAQADSDEDVVVRSAKRKDREANGSEESISYRPDMPDWGAFLRWPEDGEQWICDEDVEVVRQLVPSRRVWRRTDWQDGFYHLCYGETKVRVRPSMWTAAPAIDLEVGQQVEVLSKQGENDPGIFRIREILLTECLTACEYVLQRDEMPLEHVFQRNDLRPIHVRYELRSGYYEHQRPRAQQLESSELLDVGDLESDE